MFSLRIRAKLNHEQGVEHGDPVEARLGWLGALMKLAEDVSYLIIFLVHDRSIETRELDYSQAP